MPSPTDVLIDVGRRLDSKGWCPATSGNLSVRAVEDGVLWVTRSGAHKGYLSSEDFLQVDFDGAPKTPGKPSAETGLHCAIYRQRSEVGAVLHAHSPGATVVSRLVGGADAVTFEGYELQKAFMGCDTHETSVRVPIFDNTQDVPSLARSSEEVVADPSVWVYLIRGHGAYAWGRDAEEAFRHLEALETLLHYELMSREHTP